MEECKKALTEVSVIINNMPDELSSKISKKFKSIVEIEKDKEYNPDVNELVMKNNMLPETMIILGMIYRDFLCSESEREILKNKELEEFRKRNEEKNKIYSYENLFKDNKTQNNTKSNDLESVDNKIEQDILDFKEIEKVGLIEIKNKWYEKVLEFFKNLFKK